MVSIIVPVYNTQDYIEQCINSLINQTYKNIEIILVNDGSTDRSAQICDNYAEIDKRIKVIHKENQGTELSRKRGLSECNGERVMFVDSDDYLELNAIETAVKKMEVTGADIVCFNYIFKGRLGFESQDDELLNAQEALKHMLLLEKLDGNLPCKLYKTRLLNNDNVVFRDKRNCDILTCAEILSLAKSILVIPFLGYHYTYREGSQSHSYKLHPREEEYTDGTYALYKGIEEHYSEIKEEAEYYWLHSMLYVFIHMEKDVKLKRKSKRYQNFKKNIQLKIFFKNKYFNSGAQYIKLLMCYVGVFRYVFFVYQKIKGLLLQKYRKTNN